MNAMKMLIAGMGAAAMLVWCCTPALAAEEDEGEIILHPTTQAPVYEVSVDGADTGVDVSMMVPVRSLAESLEWTVTWQGEGRVWIDTGQWHTTITIGQPLYKVEADLGGESATTVPYTMEMAPVIINGYTYAPLSLFCALLGVDRSGVTLEDGKIHIRTQPVKGEEAGNSMTSHKTKESLETTLGFGFLLPALPAAYELKSLFDISGTMAELYWASPDNGIFYRVSMGSEYNSGVFMVYPSSGYEAVGGIDVFFRGVGEKFQIAEWISGAYSYSLFAENGLSLEELSAIVESTLAE